MLVLLVGVCLPSGTNAEPYAVENFIRLLEKLKRAINSTCVGRACYINTCEIESLLNNVIKLLGSSQRYRRVAKVTIEDNRHVSINFGVVKQPNMQGGKEKKVKRAKLRKSGSVIHSKEEHLRESRKPQILDLGLDIRAPGKDERGFSCRKFAIYLKPFGYNDEYARHNIPEMLQALNMVVEKYIRNNGSGIRGRYPRELAEYIEYGREWFVIFNLSAIASYFAGKTLTPILYVAGPFANYVEFATLVIAEMQSINNIAIEIAATRVCTEKDKTKYVSATSTRVGENTVITERTSKGGEGGECEEKIIEAKISLFKYEIPASSPDELGERVELQSTAADVQTTTVIHSIVDYAKTLDDILYTTWVLESLVKRLSDAREMSKGAFSIRTKKYKERKNNNNSSDVSDIICVINKFNELKTLANRVSTVKPIQVGQEVELHIRGIDKIEEIVNTKLQGLNDSNVIASIGKYLVESLRKCGDKLECINKTIEEVEVLGEIATIRETKSAIIELLSNVAEKILETIFDEARKMILDGIFTRKKGTIVLRPLMQARSNLGHYKGVIDILCRAQHYLGMTGSCSKSEFDRIVWDNVCLVYYDGVKSERRRHGFNFCDFAARLTAYIIASWYTLVLPNSLDVHRNIDALLSRLRDEGLEYLLPLLGYVIPALNKKVCECQRYERSGLIRVMCGCDKINKLEGNMLEEIEQQLFELVSRLHTTYIAARNCCNGKDSMECQILYSTLYHLVLRLLELELDVWKALANKKLSFNIGG